MSLTISRLILKLSGLHRYLDDFFLILSAVLLKSILIIRIFVITVMYCNRLRAWWSIQSRLRGRSGSMVECLTRDLEAAGSSLTGVTALWSLSKTYLS